VIARRTRSAVARGPGRAVTLVALLFVSTACGLPQEGPGSSDLWLVEVVEVVGLSSFGEPVNLTDRPGYDDHPAFLPDGTGLLYVSRRRADVDVMRLDLATRDRTLLTAGTSDRVYSPQPIPGGNGFSAVLVAPGGAQRLVRFAGADDRAEPFADVAGESVSYYTWVDAHTLAIVVRGKPSELRLVDLAGRRVELLARAVGRSVQAVPGRRAVSWVDQQSPTEWWIMEHDLDSGSTVSVARTLEGQVDHAWLPDGALLMAQEARIYRFPPGGGGDWTLVADYTDRGVGAIGRIAVDSTGTRVVFVAERPR